MVIVLIRTRLRADADLPAYEAAAARMDALVGTMPGYLGARAYTGPDGDVSMITFASMDALLAWRNHPEHVEVQRRGREEFYASYTVEVCDVVRAYRFP